MNWDQYRQVMERSAIKIDNMAAEDSYFMATHMPFPLLEVYRGGHTSDTPVMMTEDEVFERLIYNPENEHRMIIVRGDNGTGKSHLMPFSVFRVWKWIVCIPWLWCQICFRASMS